MSAIIVFFAISCLRGIYSQYYGYESACPYQPYNYFNPSPVLPYMYASTAYPTSYAQPISFAPPAMTFAQPMYVPAPAPIPNKPSPAAPIQIITQGLPAPKTKTPTATAYYLTPRSKPPKAVVIKGDEKSVLEKIEIAKEIENVLTPPTHPCPFCNGFKDVPKNSKVSPPPSSYSILPGIIDKIPFIECDCKTKEISEIPTIGLEEKCKLKDKITLLSDHLQQKLAGKLKFDEDLLDGFLTGLGLKK